MDDYPFMHNPYSDATLQLIDDVLLAEAGRIWEETRDTKPPGVQIAQANWRAEERRRSALGQNLLRVADYVNGGSSTMDEEAERAMKQILRTLYGDPLGEGSTIPDQFHTTKLGALFHQASERLYGPRNLMTPAHVFKELGIARTTLYTRVNTGKLHPIYRSNGEMRLLRSEIEAWKKQREQRKKRRPPSS